MITQRKAANALSGKTARACDGCSRKRARWFCPADDAFLCQACDDSVHSANQLASRHERVRLQTASYTTGSMKAITVDSQPAWHQGFTRKARTPRHNSKSSLVYQKLKDEEKVLNNHNRLLPLVPEIGSEGEEGNSTVANEDEDLSLYRVPVFDPFAAEDMVTCEGAEIGINEDGNMVFNGCRQERTCDLDNLPGFLPLDMDLADFAADVENLLGQGLHDDSADIKDLGSLEYCKEEDDDKFCFGDKVVRVKDEEDQMDVITGCHSDQGFDIGRESLDWNISYTSPINRDEIEEEEKAVPALRVDIAATLSSEHKKEMKSNASLLRLNYDAVITAWAKHGSSPWTTGSRPELNPDDCWPDCMDTCPKDGHHPYRGNMGRGNGGREERVMRYKEKRRTRLFSKKIRYEVRKLNAEKRPRMKGRFVKRTSFMGTAFPYINT